MSKLLAFKPRSNLFCGGNLPDPASKLLDVFSYKEFGTANTKNKMHTILVFANLYVIAHKSEYDEEMPVSCMAKGFERDAENQFVGFQFWYRLALAGEALTKIKRCMSRTLRLDPFSPGDIETDTLYLPDAAARILLTHNNWKELVYVGGSKSPLVRIEAIPNSAHKRFTINEELYGNLAKAGLCDPPCF